MAVEGGPVNQDSGCLAELEIACILYRTSSVQRQVPVPVRHRALEMWNPTHDDTTSEQNFT